MPKSKKKKHPKQKPLVLKAPRYKNTDDEHFSLLNPKIMYRETDFETDLPAKSSLCKEVEECLFSKVPEERKASDILLTNEVRLQAFINRIVNDYFTSHKDIDKDLIPVDSNSSKFDIIDFKDYGAEYKSKTNGDDILKQIYRIVSDDPDPSLLWPISEYVRIDYSNVMHFTIHRISYDADTKRTKYEMVCYQKFILVKNQVIEFPICHGVFEVGIDTLQAIDDEFSTIDSDSSKFDKAIITAVKTENLLNGKTYMDLPVYRILSISSVNDLDKYGNKYIACKDLKANSHEKNIMSNLFSKLMTNVIQDYDGTITSDVHATNFMRQKLSIPIACIILTNHMLKTQKMSKPVTKRISSIKHTVNETAVNVPVRKVRHLGRIKIESETKPTAPTVEKIIRYTMSQWGRRGYIRHYKSGKTVEIKPTTVHRKCVEINAATDNQSSTKYVIHSDDIANKKG